MPCVVTPTEQKDQLKEHEPGKKQKEKKEQKETASSCGIEKSSCCS